MCVCTRVQCVHASTILKTAHRWKAKQLRVILEHVHTFILVQNIKPKDHSAVHLSPLLQQVQCVICVANHKLSTQTLSLSHAEDSPLLICVTAKKLHLLCCSQHLSHDQFYLGFKLFCLLFFFYKLLWCPEPVQHVHTPTLQVCLPCHHIEFYDLCKTLKEMYNLILWKQTCLRGLVSRNNNLGKQKAEQEGAWLL